MRYFRKQLFQRQASFLYVTPNLRHKGLVLASCVPFIVSLTTAALSQINLHPPGHHRQSRRDQRRHKRDTCTLRTEVRSDQLHSAAIYNSKHEPKILAFTEHHFSSAAIN
jgi:hypothetical protein